MKLRRAMAVAAATAVIAPAAFFAAPAAFATEGDTTAPQTSAESPGSETPGSETPEAGAGETGETPPVVETPPTDEAPAPPETGEETAGTPPTKPEEGAPEEGTPEAGKPSPSASQSTPAAEPSETSAGEAPGTPVECSEDGDLVDDDFKTSLTGLPERVVAGSGFHGFKFNVSNQGKNVYKRVDLGVFAGQIDEKTWEITSQHLTLQYKDPESGQWINISLDDNDEGAGYLGYTDVRAKESFSIDLRLSVDKSAPAGLGYAIGIGVYADDKGNCVMAGDFASYEFEIVAAGSDAGNPGEAKPQPRPQTGGKKPIPAKPVGNTEIKPQGHLAETGSSSTVPVIGMVGGIAIVAGAGVMFAMKRRRNGDAAA
ncbi:LPXTG cell wall anchor domain-containing protein [Streptomyces sp. NPDC088124]|uniref:LPXTG cell wall anchor domain-containing protein n=1 Tax=Streptomyces sp. NPDC088124 TaxID=3154654 RepID=UPI003430A2FA